ncbi:MAG: hypothetical protein AB9907_07745 [Flexilinea sp.]
MTNTDMAQAGEQADQAAHQESLPRRIQQVMIWPPGKFFTRLELAAVLSAVFFVVQGISISSSNIHNSNEQRHSIRPVAAQSQTPATTDGEQSAEKLSLDEKVNLFVTHQIEHPGNLTDEENLAFDQKVNEIRGPQAIYAERVDKNSNPIVIYYDVAQNKMVNLQGTYEQHKDVIDQNSLDIIVSIRTEANTGNLQVRNPQTGELIAVPNSANFKWNKIVDQTNMYDGTITWPTTKKVTVKNSQDMLTNAERFVKYPNAEGLKGKFFPVVLLEDEPKELASFSHGGEVQNYYCLHVAFIRTNEIGEPTHGVSGFIGPQAVMYKTTEGQSEQLDLARA